MGLDMYLTKKTFIGAEYEHRKITGEINIFQDGKRVNIDFNRVSEITESAGYWRKANHIHNWFVENVQDGKDDCGEYYVSEDNMEELLNICKTIKDECPLVPATIRNGRVYKDGEWVDILEDGYLMNNSHIASKLLPTRDGFFFGSTDYNQYYMQDIEDTIKILEECLKDESGMYYYSSSW